MALAWYDHHINGLSTDSKPTAHPNTGAALDQGWRFYETDTQAWYAYSADGWIEAYGTQAPVIPKSMPPWEDRDERIILYINRLFALNGLLVFTPEETEG